MANNRELIPPKNFSDYVASAYADILSFFTALSFEWTPIIDLPPSLLEPLLFLDMGKEEMLPRFNWQDSCQLAQTSKNFNTLFQKKIMDKKNDYLLRLSSHFVNSEQMKAEAILKKNPRLLFLKTEIALAPNYILHNISLAQYAILALEVKMLHITWRYASFNENQTPLLIAQLNEIESAQIIEGNASYLLEKLTKALLIYIHNFQNRGKEKSFRVWKKNDSIDLWPNAGLTGEWPIKNLFEYWQKEVETTYQLLPAYYRIALEWKPILKPDQLISCQNAFKKMEEITALHLRGTEKLIWLKEQLGLDPENGCFPIFKKLFKL